MQEVELRELRRGDVFEEVSYGVAHYLVLSDPRPSEEEAGIELYARDMETGENILFFESVPGFLGLTRLN